jgi:hypothetical protein
MAPLNKYAKVVLAITVVLILRDIHASVSQRAGLKNLYRPMSGFSA